MVHILDTLTRLENKFDNLAIANGQNTPDSLGHRATSHSSASSARPRRSETDGDTQQYPTELQQGYHHLTVPHKIILWPSIYIHLLNSDIQATSDLQYVLQEGTPWFIRQEMSSNQGLLPPEVGLSSFALYRRSPGESESPRIGFTELVAQRIQEQCDAYFNSFNVLTPILNRDVFMSDTMDPILANGFQEGDANSIVVLLVLALGQVAIEGVFERPVSVVNGAPSGIRGGTIQRPPGLEIFNEARRRAGYVANQVTLASVQIQLLTATYYEAAARHIEFWHCTISASMTCLVLIRCQSIDWQTPYGDLVKRAYWTCLISEDLYHLDLDLPRSGIADLEDTVPLPYFHEGGRDIMGFPSNDDKSHFQYNFLAMIALRRLISRIHEAIHEGECLPYSATCALLTVQSLFRTDRTDRRLWRAPSGSRS